MWPVLYLYTDDKIPRSCLESTEDRSIDGWGGGGMLGPCPPAPHLAGSTHVPTSSRIRSNPRPTYSYREGITRRKHHGGDYRIHRTRWVVVLRRSIKRGLGFFRVGFLSNMRRWKDGRVHTEQQPSWCGLSTTTTRCTPLSSALLSLLQAEALVSEWWLHPSSGFPTSVHVCSAGKRTHCCCCCCCGNLLTGRSKLISLDDRSSLRGE